MKRIYWMIVLIDISVSACQQVGQRVKDNRPDLLHKLDGRSGHKPQVYPSAYEGCNIPPSYEALIFIGYDSRSEKIYTHWMDSFGGAYSVPHGEGSIEESTIEFQIPYKPSAFRDRFICEPAEDSWTLVIDSRNNCLNTWENFALYKIRRRKR